MHLGRREPQGKLYLSVGGLRPDYIAGMPFDAMRQLGAT
jgi:hypothetical protein